MSNKKQQQTKQPQKQPMTAQQAEDILAELRQPPQPKQALINSIEDVKRLFSIPQTMGYAGMHELDSDDPELNPQLAADSAMSIGYDQIYQSLIQHGMDLGQYPMTSFVGYGVLQQIAQNGMIRTCIQTVADDITREWITITGGDKTDPSLIDNLTHEFDRLKMRTVFNRAIAMMGYMGGALIYIDTGTDDPSIPLVLNENSDEIKKGTKLKFVVVDPVNCSPGKYNATNPLAEDYLTDPKSWYILGREVHASRLIVLRDNLPPTLLRPAYNFLGIPQAQILWDYVMHWNRARVSVAGILEKLNLLVFQTNSEYLLSSSGGVQQLDAKMLALSRYRDNDSVVVCDKNSEDIKNITLTISGVTDVVRQALEFIAAINRTPAVKLLGISPSGFNATGESDIRNYYDHIMSKQELLHDGILRALKAVELSTLGQIDSSINFEFNPLGTEDEEGDIQSASARVNMLNSLLQTNVLSAEEVRQAVKADQKTNLGFISDDVPQPNEGADIAEMSDLNQGTPEAADNGGDGNWMTRTVKINPDELTRSQPEIRSWMIAGGTHGNDATAAESTAQEA